MKKQKLNANFWIIVICAGFFLCTSCFSLLNFSANDENVISVFSQNSIKTGSFQLTVLNGITNEPIENAKIVNKSNNFIFLNF